MRDHTATFWKAYLPIVVGLALTMPLLGVLLLLPPAVWFGVRWAVPRVREGLRLRRELVMRNREEEARRSEEERRERERERQRLAYEAGEPDRRSEKERRHTAQWQCEKFYLLHARDLEGRLSPDVFIALRKSQLGDHLAVEFVEANARELLDLMRLHLERPAAAAGASEARAMVQRYYAEHLGLLRTAFPAALFEATLNAQVPEGAQRDAAWTAAREMIAGLQDAVLQEETRLQSAGKERQGRERRLRRIEREIAERREHVRRLGSFGEAGDDQSDISLNEVEQQEKKVQELEDEREDLVARNERDEP